MAKNDNQKKIAGLKLPKSIRQIPAIRALLSTSKGRDLLAEALVEGAATAAAKVIAANPGLIDETARNAPVLSKAAKAKKPARAKPTSSFGAPHAADASSAKSAAFEGKEVEPLVRPLGHFEDDEDMQGTQKAAE